LIGGPTYGKGTVQATVPLVGDVMLQYTVGKWLSPGGVWVDENGVQPDILVVDDPATEVDEVIQAALEYIEKNTP
jgi:carboxyl-terminal processing protease